MIERGIGTMKNFLSALLILSGYTLILGTFPTDQCINNDLCHCFREQADSYEFQCPKKGDSKIIVKTKQEFMRVDCVSADPFDLEIFPNYTAGNLQYLWMESCLLPEEGFLPFLQKYGIDKLTSFKIFVRQSENSSIKEITSDVFQGMSSLQSLTVNSENTTFDENFLQFLPNLTSLDMGGSNLKGIRYIFKHTPKLLEIYLTRNSIETIPNRLFENLTNLQRLHLWKNQLTVLTKDQFVGLKNLRSLELSNNRIYSIEPYTFSELPMLVNISLFGNKLGHVSSELFRNNSKLKKIRINSNTNLTLADKCFANLRNLTTLEMGNSKVKIIPENVFEGSTNIEILLMQYNLLQGLPAGIFKDLRKLKELNLSFNKISALPHGIFSSTNLEKLDLGHNLLATIDENTLDASHLKTLVLNNNRLTTISPSTFYNVKTLKSLDLSNNYIKLGELFNPFSQCIGLENLDLHGNRLSTFHYDILTMLHLKSLNLKNNQISDIIVLHLRPLSELNIDLTSNNISFINFEGISLIENNPENRSLTVVDLEDNYFICDCRNFELMKYLNGDYPVVRASLELRLGSNRCAGPDSFRHIQINELKPRHISCIYPYEGCPDECQCFFRPFDQTVVVECDNRNLTDWPVIGFKGKRIELNLSGNMLTHSPEVSRQYNNITNLFLSNNNLEILEWVPSEIQVLKLDGNNLTHIESSLLKWLSNSSRLANITLTGNPWTCGCIGFDLQNFIRANSHKVNNWQYILCNEDNQPLMDKKVLCSPPSPSVLILQIALPIVVFVLIIVSLTAFYAFYEQEIKIWLYAHNITWIHEEDLDKDMEYDIFLSYSHKDEDFVIQNLLPVLEDGPNPYKICIHVRDFFGGEYIMTHVTNTVLKSRRTLVVLSNNFLESAWGKCEFRLAHTQGIEESRTRLVVIKYGALNEEKLDDDLKMYLKTNTYVEWGKPWFWNKLRYALPHTKSRDLKKLDQKHANMMLKIDDKFGLALPPLVHPESTPPIMTVDPPLMNGKLNDNCVETPLAEAPTIIN